MDMVLREIYCNSDVIKYLATDSSMMLSNTSIIGANWSLSDLRVANHQSNTMQCNARL